MIGVFDATLSVLFSRAILNFEHAAFELIALNLDFFFFLFYLFIHENQINCFDFRGRAGQESSK